MRDLCAKALEQGIETEYVRELIGRLGLVPPPHDAGVSVFDLEDWPYPIKIITLGGFEVLKNDKPLPDGGKVQKKPLEMLRAVIALGGTNVPAEHLADVLWPEAEGDLAHKSFEMTLSRLRRLLGGENFVRYRAGHLSIDPDTCWVDSLVLERMIGKIEKSPADQVIRFCEKAVGLYGGAFLPSDTTVPWTAHRREMLKNGMLRAITAAGRYSEQAGLWERAVEYYTKGLATDDLAEEFYQRLMVCYGKLGNHAGAVKAYDRCRRLLREHLGIGPSLETEAIHSSMFRKR